MASLKIHQHSSHVMSNPLMPHDVRDKYQREGMRGTLCGYVRPGAQVSDNKGETTCVLCLREQKKAQFN